MNPVNQALRFFGSLNAATTFAPYNSPNAFFDYPEVTTWTIWLNSLTSVFNGTVVFEFAEIARDPTFATFVAPATINVNGGTATFTQPAAFTGTQVIMQVFQFPLPPWRLRCSAFTSGSLGIAVVGV